MGLLRRKDKRGKESKPTRMFRLFLWHLFKRTRCREKIEKANRWAERNKGRTAAMTIGALSLMLVVGTVTSLTAKVEPDANVMEGIAKVNPMFQGLQRIQDYKAYQISQVEELTMRGKRLKEELDSLIHIPRKTHDDSLQIVIKYKQLEMIVNNLENRQR